MKQRKGHQATDNTGTTWYGDCPKWAEEQRQAGMTVVPLMIRGKSKWDCSACRLGLAH